MLFASKNGFLNLIRAFLKQCFLALRYVAKLLVVESVDGQFTSSETVLLTGYTWSIWINLKNLKLHKVGTILLNLS